MEFLKLHYDGKQICMIMSDAALRHRLAKLAASLNSEQNDVARVALLKGLENLEVIVEDVKGEGQAIRAELAMKELARQEVLAENRQKLAETEAGRAIAARYGVKLQ